MVLPQTKIRPQTLFLNITNTAGPTNELVPSYVGMLWLDTTTTVPGGILRVDSMGAGVPADFVTVLPEHTVTGHHGPRVQIDQTSAIDNALVITKAGASSAVSVLCNTTGAGRALEIVSISNILPAVYVLGNGNGGSIQVSNSGTGVAVSISQSTSEAIAFGVTKYATGSTACCFVTNSGSGEGIVVNQVGDGFGVRIYENGESQALRIEKSSTGANVAFELFNSGSGQGINVDQRGNGTGIQVTSTAASTSPSIQVENYGTGAGILVDQIGNGIGLNVNKTNTGNANAVSILNSGSGAGVFVSQPGTGTAVSVSSAQRALLISSTTTSASHLIDVVNSCASSALDISQNTAIPGNGAVLKINQNASSGRGLEVDVNSAANTNSAILISNSGSGNDIYGSNGNWNVDKNGNASFKTVNKGGYPALAFFGGRTGGSAVSVNGNGTASISIGAVQVPANAFPNGLMVVFTAEIYAFNEEGVVVEAMMDQSPWGGMLRVISNTPLVWARDVAGPAIPPAQLGYPAMFDSTGCNDGEAWVVGTHTAQAIWVRSGFPNLFGGGGFDWNPTKATNIDFTLMYAQGASTVRVGRRAFTIMGF